MYLLARALQVLPNKFCARSSARAQSSSVWLVVYSRSCWTSSRSRGRHARLTIAIAFAVARRPSPPTSSAKRPRAPRRRAIRRPVHRPQSTAVRSAPRSSPHSEYKRKHGGSSGERRSGTLRDPHPAPRWRIQGWEARVHVLSVRRCVGTQTQPVAKPRDALGRSCGGGASLPAVHRRVRQPRRPPRRHARGDATIQSHRVARV